MTILENFVKSYTDKTYKYVTTVRHKGTVVAFAMDDHRQIYYAVLDLNDAGKDKSPLDVNYWPDNPSPLPFGNELAQVGYGIIDPEVMPVVKKGTRQIVDAGKLRPEEIDPFLSTTARFSADAPFQVLSDNQYIYVFRQSIDADHEDNILAQKKNHEIIQDSAGVTVSLVNDTLLLDRFVLTGKQLHPKMEVRFKRSRNKYRPQSNKDSLGAQDMNKKPFREPTQELDFVENLRNGRFSVLLLPTQVAGVQRWQIFTHNQKTGLIDSFNIERSDDGLFNTKGSQFYTSPDPKYQKSVYEREPGTDPFTGKPLVPIVDKTGYGEYAIECAASNAVILLDSVVNLKEAWTIEFWFIFPLPPSTWCNTFIHGLPYRDYVILVNSGQLGVYKESWKQGYHFCGYNFSELSAGWHHLTAVGKDCQTIFYIDGQNVGMSDYQSRTEVHEIGNYLKGGAPWGTFDELRIWNRARSEAEIQADLHYRLEGNEPDLEAYWRFDENTGNVIHDLTGNGHNGTLNGSCNWVPSDAPIGERSGIRRSSFALNGRTIESGLSALLYYQQEKAITGYDEQTKPLKRNARVMLAANTSNPQADGKQMGNESGNKYIAALDFAVSREGKLAQVPDNLDLGTTLSAGNSEDLQRLEKLEQEIEDLRINYKTMELVASYPDDDYQIDGDSFGRAVACTQEWLMISEKNQKQYYPNHQRIYFFHLESEGAAQAGRWVQKAVFSVDPNDAGHEVCFTGQIAIQGEWAIAGGYRVQNYSQSIPILYIFHLENGTWIRKQRLIWEDIIRSGDLSSSGVVSLNLYGEWALTLLRRDGGQVGQFLHLEDGEWVKSQQEIPTDSRVYYSMSALAGKWALLGSYNMGNLYAFQLEGQTWKLKQTIRVSGICSIAVSGEWALVGTLWSGVLMFQLEEGIWSQKQTFSIKTNSFSIVKINGEWGAVSSCVQISHSFHKIEVEIFHLEKGKWRKTQDYSYNSYRAESAPIAISDDGDYFIAEPYTNYGVVHASYKLSAEIAAKQAECDALQKKVGAVVALPMHLLHTDPFGLTVSGGLLGFANSSGAPQLFDSATGKLALYYPGQDQQFFAAYYDTQTAKAQYSLQVALNPTETETGQVLHTTSLLAVAGSADPAMDETQIEISGDIDPDTCTVTITNPTTGITETWHHVPRNPAEFAKAINGAGDEPLFIGTLNTKVSATVTNLTLAEPLKRSLKNGAILRIGAIKTTITKAVDRASMTIPIASTYIQAAAGTLVQLIAYDYSQATTNKPNYRLQTGSLYVRISEELTEGRVCDGTYTHNSEPTLNCQWVSDAPGKALSFDGNEYLYLKTDDSNHALANLDFQGDLTLEAWVQPAGGSVRIIHHHSDNAHYTLGLKEDTSKLWFFAAAGETAKQAQIALESKQNSQKEWHHLAAVYHQSYGLQFDGGANLEATSSDVLNQDGDLTLEIFLQPADLATRQGLLAKGNLNDGTSERVPYALYLETDGTITFVFEDSDGGSHAYTSSRSIQAGQFHKIAVTRKHQSKTNKVKVDKNHPEKAQDIDASKIYEQWTDICFYIDDQRTGYARYEGASPGTNGQPLEIGKVSEANGKNYFRGIMSEVRLWNKALSSPEVGKRLQGREQGLVAWWQFEENEGNVAMDSKGGQDAKILAANWVKNPDPTTGSSLILYQDGIPVPTDDLTISDWYDQQFTLGAIRTSDGFNEGFRGTLEEVRIWKVARTQEQIQDNLFTRLKGESEYLIANYTFDQESPTQLRDHSLLGNDLTLGTEENKPNFILSTAPIGTDAAIVRSALAGLETKFQDKIDDRPGVEEYGDLQRDADGNLIGLQKRCYAYLKDGQWHLLTGYKVGNLKTEWISQVQFDPQVIGFIEGAPPVPSENLTEGTLDPGKDDCADASSLEVVEAENVSYTFGASQEGSFDSAFDFSIKNGAGATVSTVTAPLGIGIATEIVDAGIDWEISTKFETSSGWSSDKSVGASRNVTKNTQVSLGGNWEDPTNKLNPTVGRRFQPSNMGFALVQSETADLFALRMEHNNALVCFRLMPNPDIPKDWNIIPFPINPSYSKQGTLDGSLGYDDTGSKVCDPDYPIATTYGEYSYFKPKEAYTIKNRINRQEQELATYYQSFDATPPGGNFAGGGAALGTIGLTASLASALTDNSTLAKKFAKRNLVNTYVWTADGGFFAESTEISENRQESTSGSFSFSGSVGGGLSGGGTFAGVKFNVGFDLSIGGSLHLTKTKSKDSETSFSIDVGINVPGDLQQYNEESNRVYDANHQPINVPGKVDAYRFMTFYLEGSSSNFAELFNKVVDPIWLEQSDHPNANAMRQAKQADKKPPCWRVFHRVTFVSRILPEFTSNAIAPVEKAMKAASIESNWELIKKLEPFVKNKTDDHAVFAKAVRQTIATYLPELEGHEDEIIKYAALYFGVQDI
jgi:hypothetical protein